MRISGNLLISVGAMLMLGSLVLNSYNSYINNSAGEVASTTYEKIQDVMLRVDDSESDATLEKTVTIEGNKYIGTITIPDLGLQLPIMYDWSHNNMKVSPCRYYGSIETNDLVLCSHSYDNLFGDIGKLKQESRIVITDMNNNKYVYEVKVVEILSPTDVNKMIESEFDLTLFTCTKDNANRMTVRLNRIK